MALTVLIYKVTEKFPKKEQYGLTSQMRRAAVSIPSNIAEGSKRGSRNDFRQFILIAYGSAAELSTQAEISFLLHYLNEKEYKEIQNLLHEIMAMLHAFSSSLRNGKTTTNY